MYNRNATHTRIQA